MSTLDDLPTGGNGGKTAKFPTIGTTHEGVLVSAVPKQATDMVSKELKFWKDGNPVMQAVLGFQTSERNPEIDGDDGVRYVYSNWYGQQKQAYQAAQKALPGGRHPEPGDYFKITYTGDGKATQVGFNAPKIYAIEFKAGSPMASLGSPAPAAVAAPAPAAPAPAPAPVQQGGIAPATEAQILALIGNSLKDAEIARVIDGVTEQDVATLRLVAAARSGGPGF